ncbi:PAS domain S-box protein [Acetobacteraceae bacterium AT-5844]|nr:PAS domain S-box protein [Acetobacteraceae bacterium AT-5844]
MAALSRILRRGDHGSGPSLQFWLIALILLVLLPTLGVLAVTLLHAARSYQAVSERHLTETARLVSQAVVSELNTTAHLLVNASPGATSTDDGRPLLGGTRHVLRLSPGPDGYILETQPPPDVPLPLIRQAAETGSTALSGIFVAPDEEMPLLALAVPRPASGPGGSLEVLTLSTRPDLLVRTLARTDKLEDTLVLAVTDGAGHIISRSVDAAAFIGKPVPDWGRLRALGGESGLFTARTLEGPEVIFAFQSIAGTPGWVAVVGEPLEAFNARARQPVRIMVAASVLTVLAALLLASMLARRILLPIGELAVRARGVAHGDPFRAAPLSPVSPSLVAEFETLRRSLEEADTALRRSARAEREAAEAAAASERRYRTMAQIGALAFWVRDPSGAVTTTGVQSLAGLAEDEELGESWHRSVHPDDQARIDAVWTNCMQRGQPLDIEFRVRRPEGGWRWLRSRGAPVTAGHRDSAEWVGVLEDITARKDVEEALKRSYETLREAERLARIGSWGLDLKTGLFASSEMLHELNGTDPAGPPVTLNELDRLIHPGSVARLLNELTQCQASGLPFSLEIEHLRPDGSTFPAHVRGQAVRDEAGCIIALSGTVQDVTERHEERARLAALADNLPGGALYRLEEAADGALRITYISGSVQNLLGMSADTLLADRAAFLAAIHPEDRARYEDAIARSRRDLGLIDVSFRARRADGRLIWMNARAAPRRSHDGRVLWDGIMRDTTQERAAAEALRQAKESAEATERSKSDFLAAMSHEIRTPMNTVLGMTRLVLRTELSPKQRGYLEKVDASAQSLLGIIDDILDFSRFEAGGLVLEDTAFTLDAVLEQVSAVTAMKAEEKGLEMAYRVAPGAPRLLRGDPLRLGQILTNLVSNAVKFTEAGEVVVSIASAQGEDGAPMLEFAVRDTGIGLSGEQIARLFRPFAQADAGTARRYGGTGLGLAICRQLVEMMHGRIWVESRPGEGSTFFFTIPAPPAEAPSLVPGRTVLADRPVLVVDDNDNAREILCAMARKLGMDAAGAPGGAEALGLLKDAASQARPFEIVLMDWRMPVMDGLETARLIRAEPMLERTQLVLMVTAFAREEVQRGMELLGLQGPLIKPVTESALFHTLSALFTPAASGRPRQAATAGLPHALLAGLAGRRVLVVDDNALNREVAGDFLADAGMLVDTAKDGREALRQLESRDYDAVLMDVHMPEMSGLAVAREIRRHPRWARLPIIALTAHARGEDREASLAAGMNAHLTKPIDENMLYRALAEAMHGTAPGAPAPPQAESMGEGLDLALVLRRLGGRPERAARLLRGFLRDFATGPEQMTQHLGGGRVQEAATLAHTARGSAAYLGAEAFCKSAELLEKALLNDDRDAVARLGPAFTRGLGDLLAATRRSLETLPGAAGGGAAATALIPLLDRAMPLAERGDYEAQALLERVAQGLGAGVEGDLARRASACFDELDLSGALLAMRQLRATLRGATP